MVPNGWEKTDLTNLINIKHGFAFKSEYFREIGEYILLTPGSFYEKGGFKDQKDKTKYYIGEIPDSYLLTKNDLLIAMTEQASGLLGSALFVPEKSTYLHNQRLGKVEIKAKERIDLNFLYLTFNSPPARKQISEQSTGTKVKHTSPDKLKSIICLLPPLPEQQKIAKILSTWDNAISTTERLIENSTQQKKALMQQLLTGKKRLLSTNSSFSVRDGFAKSKLGELPDDWNLSLIPKFYWFQEGPGVRKHQFTETGVKLLNGTNIQKSRVDLTTTKTHISEDEAYGGYKHFLADSGDLIIACSGISVDRFDEKIAFLEDHHLPLCMNTSTMRFKVKKDAKASLEFLRYFMMSPLFKNQIRRQITGSAQLNFGPSHVDKCYIALPSYDEQQKIAAVLINADKQIDLLEQQLADLQQEKKALMQVLLTGKKRVVIDEDNL